MKFSEYRDRLVALGEFENVKIKYGSSASILPGWVIDMQVCMRKIQEGLDESNTEDAPTITLWLDEDALPNGDLALRKRYYCDESKGSDYKQFVEGLVVSAIDGYTQAVKQRCAFCGVDAVDKYARRGVPRCEKHRYIDIEAFSPESWEEIYSEQIDNINREAERLLNAYEKWKDIERACSNEEKEVVIDRDKTQRTLRRIASPRFITSMALSILLKNSRAKPEWIRDRKQANAFYHDMEEGYTLGVDTLPMLIALGAMLLLNTGDKAVSMSYADGLLMLNAHRWTLVPAECMRALDAVTKGIWSTAEFADWISCSIAPNTEGSVCAA